MENRGMHEASIAAALMEQVRPFVPEGAALHLVRLDVGALEHIDDEVLQAAWDGMTDGTGLASSSIEVTRIPLRVRCRQCGVEHEPEDIAVLVCPECGAAQPEVLQGSGVLLRGLEVDQTIEQTEDE